MTEISKNLQNGFSRIIQSTQYDSSQKDRKNSPLAGVLEGLALQNLSDWSESFDLDAFTQNILQDGSFLENIDTEALAQEALDQEALDPETLNPEALDKVVTSAE